MFGSPIVVSLVGVENPTLSTIDVVADRPGLEGMGAIDRESKG